MIEISIPRETAGLLGAHIEAHFSSTALHAGLALYTEHRVTHIWKDQFNIIHAIVGATASGTKLQLDLDFFLASECQCSERFCPHMAAVFFALYAQHEDPQQWVSDVEDVLAAADSGNQRSQAQQPSLAGIALLTEEQPLQPNRWQEQMTKELHALYQRQTDRYRIDIFYYTAYKKLAARAEMLSVVERPYFRIYCAILIMLHAEQHFDAHGRDYPLPYYERLAADISQHLTQRLREAIGLTDRAGAIDDRTQQACAETLYTLMISRLPVPAPTSLNWVPIHRYVWEQLFHQQERLHKEEARLHALEEVEPWSSPENAEQLALMSAHISWLLGRDQDAMRKLARPHLSAGDLMIAYIETHYQTRSWTRLGQWLSYSLPQLRRFPADAFNRALLIWREYAVKMNHLDSYANALSQLLPRSYLPFTEHLLQSEQHREWVNFHLLNGISPAKMDRTQLKQLEQSQPELLLPIYHHAIARQLAAKNRAAYREAVKLMKRLRELYSSAGREPSFQLFMQELTTRYQRLHAFIEELEKGKLLV